MVFWPRALWTSTRWARSGVADAVAAQPGFERRLVGLGEHRPGLVGGFKGGMEDHYLPPSVSSIIFQICSSVIPRS